MGVINFSIPKPKYESLDFLNLDINTEPTTEQIFENVLTEQKWMDKFYTEAVFIKGKEKVKKIEECFAECKERLDTLVKEDGNKFNPKEYFKDTCWLHLSNTIKDVFGFNTVDISPWIEYYNSNKDTFSTNQMNAYTYTYNRYKIDGLVTDEGFYDKSHSITVDIRISLGLIRNATAGILTAVLLHEIGHNIDPALVHITYTDVNILSKYMTDRQGNLSKAEQKRLDELGEKCKKSKEKILKKFNKKKKNKISGEVIGYLIVLVIYFLLMMTPYTISGIGNLIYRFKRLIFGKDKVNDKIIENTVKEISSEKNTFDRQVYSEAYADNFARMYGYGSELSQFFKLFNTSLNDMIDSRIKKEWKRDKIYADLIKSMINDVHKTDLHRMTNLVKEYEEDLKDPNIPEAVKKQIREDIKNIEEVIKYYKNSNNDFRDKLNGALIDELYEKSNLDKDRLSDEEKKEEKDDKKDDKKDKKDDSKDKDKKNINESVEFFESRAAYEKLMRDKERLSPDEREEAKRLFGNVGCTFGKERDGYYCYTHRARSKAYPSINKIPKSVVEFIDSTC